MKSIVLKSALVLGLSVAPGAGLAQTELPKKKPGQQMQEQQAPTDQGTQQQTEGEASQGTPQQQMEVLKKKPGQSQEKTQAPADQGVEEQKSEGQTGTTTEGTAQTQQQREGKGGTESPGTAETQQPAQTDDTESPGTAETQQPAPTDDTAKTQGQPSSETTGSINVTAEQQTEIKQVITETKAEPVRDVDFDINVGISVPKTVELQPLPPRIVEVVPQYEGYMYFVLADGRIVIVEPDTLEIVVVIA